MNTRNKVIKKIFITFIIIAIIITYNLYYLSNTRIKIPSNVATKILAFFNKQILVVNDDIELYFSDYNFELTSSKIDVIHPSKKILKLRNIKLSFSPFLLHGVLTSKIINSEILVFAAIDNKLDQEMMDDFNKQNYLPCDGKIVTNYNLLGAQKIEAKFISNSGWHQSHNKNIPKINLNELSIDLNYQDNQLYLNKLKLQYSNNILTSLEGVFKFHNDELSSAKFKTSIQNLPIEYLDGLWPKILFPKIHKWVSSNINKGFIKNAQGTFNFTENDLKTDSIIAKDSVNVKINVSDMNLNYLSKYPPVTNIDGIIYFNGESLLLKASSAKLLNNNIYNSALTFDFNKFTISLITNASGHIKDFKDFIPDQVHNKLEKYGIPYNSINGSLDGTLSLDVPISDEFKASDLKFNLKANFKNLSVNKLTFLELKNGTIDLSNNDTKTELNIHDKNSLSINLLNYHEEKNNHLNQINITGNIAIEKEITLGNIQINNGKININTKIIDNEWNTNLDLINTEVFFIPLGYKKLLSDSLNISCSGQILDDSLESNNCSIGGSKFKGTASFVYSYKDNILSKLVFSNLRINDNNFNLEIFSKKGFSSYNITAKSLNLSQTKEIKTTSEKSNFKFSLKADKVFVKNNIHLSDVKANIELKDNNPPDISFFALSNGDKISISKAKKNNKEFYSLHSSSASLFSQAFDIYKNIKKGELLIELHPTVTPEGIDYNGTLSIKKFYLSNTSILTKVMLGVLSPFNSPQAIAKAFQGGSLQADHFLAKLHYNNGVLKLKEGVISGTSYDVKINGIVDVNKKYLDFKGLYIPSLYGINTLISSIPLLGSLISGGDKSAFLAVSFGVKGNFDNPISSVNPLSVFTPGFIRNIFN